MMNAITRRSSGVLLVALLVCGAVGSAAGLKAKAPATTKPAAGKAPMHIYLLIGQSNMAGRAAFTEEEAAEIPRCGLLDRQGKWVPAKNPLNIHSTIRKSPGMQKMNPGYTFAKTMLEKDKTVSIGLVVNAKGGTSIRSWAKGSKFYKEAVKRTKLAQETGVLKGVLWHQGESDSMDSKYIDKLKALIADLRKDLGAANLPFVAGEIQNCKLVNDQIRQLPEEVKCAGFASAEGLTTRDRWHFDARSMKLLGMRYAEAMLKVQAKQKAMAKKKQPTTRPSGR
ncbi:MAG: sialate O-acetylesterase [Phycisphaerae bacterium]|jgi:hypothetical protein|nr:sialate O-acetylesterase [Phycisphaerae bacterium]MDP7287715.1 sialate O-acetylesterase [Phycisphaerae bacterium]